MRALLVLLLFVSSAARAELVGFVVGPSGERMAGVAVSAKPDAGTIRTSVFTDSHGKYRFPELAPGKYRLTAQAIGYRTARATLELPSQDKHDFSLVANADAEQTFRQMPGNMALNSLPEATPHDKLMKQLVRNDCTSCHTASYPLQHRFDEAGWNKIIELMKNVNVGGLYVAKDRAPSGILDYHQKELAAYLAKARGPDSKLALAIDPRPSGEAARVVIREYDLPLDPERNLPADFVQNDGSDWSLGTPSTLIPGWGVHDAWLDDDGRVWFTCNVPNQRTSIGRVDTKTGEVKLIRIPAKSGLAANSHGMTRTPDGMIWFNINPGRGGLGRLDPRTEKIDVFIPPEDLSPTGGATTVDYDGKGKIWVSAPDGVLRFDPATEKWTGYKTATFKTPNGTGITYGAAADRAGNGYWAVMIHDIVGVADGATGKASEIKLAPAKGQLALVPREALEFYKTYSQPDFNNPLPFAEGPRRMGTDKNADVLWVGNSWGASLARIDTRTRAVSYVDLPGRMQPYHVHVDSRHRAWTNVWGADRVMRYDPATKKWTAFDLPTRGAEPRYVSVHEAKDANRGEMQVVLPYFRARKIAVMTVPAQ
jgi:streptogramin lyase